MANEFVARKGIIAQANSTITGSLKTTGLATFNVGTSIPVDQGAGFGSNSSIYEDSTDGYFNFSTTAPLGFSIRTPDAIFEMATSAYLYATDTITLSAYNENIVFNTGGSERMRLTNAGNLGIGKTTPSQKLDVLGNVNITGSLNISGSTTIVGNILQVNGPTGVARAITHGISFFNGSTDYRIAFDSVSGTRGYIRHNVDTAASTHGHIFSAGSYTGTPTDLMLVRGDGLVGIGTTTPASLLEILQSQNADTSFRITNTNAGGSARANLTMNGQASNYQISVNDSYIQHYTAASLPYQFWNGGTEKMRLTNAGNLGIGTTNPIGKLTVLENTTSFEVNTSSTKTQILSYDRTGGAYKQLEFRGTDFIFAPSDVEKMRLSSAGNLGIGKSSPGTTLDVSGSVNITGSVQGNVSTLSITSNTASIDLSRGNFFTLTLSGSTHFTATNIKPGQTVNILLTTNATNNSASFSSTFKQPSGSAYTPTGVNGAKDILTLISYDTTNVYVASVKYMI